MWWAQLPPASHLPILLSQQHDLRKQRIVIEVLQFRDVHFSPVHFWGYVVNRNAFSSKNYTSLLMLRPFVPRHSIGA